MRTTDFSFRQMRPWRGEEVTDGLVPYSGREICEFVRQQWSPRQQPKRGRWRAAGNWLGSFRRQRIQFCWEDEAADGGPRVNGWCEASGGRWLARRVPCVSVTFLAHGGLRFWGDLGREGGLGPRVVEVSFSFFVFLSI